MEVVFDDFKISYFMQDPNKESQKTTCKKHRRHPKKPPKAEPDKQVSNRHNDCYQHLE